MHQKISLYKNLRFTTIGLMILVFLLAIISPIISKLGYPSIAKIMLLIVFNFLLPFTLVLIIPTFILNLNRSYSEKRTTSQELIVKQNFWGKTILLGVSLLIVLISIITNLLGDWWMIEMIVLFIASFLFGSKFGRIVIRK